MLSAGNGEDGNYDCVDERPDESRNGVEVVAEKLHAKAGGVVDCDVVADDGEDKEDEAEFGEAERVEAFSEQAAEPVVIVCGGQNGIYLRGHSGVSEACPDDGNEDGRDRNAKEGQEEDLPCLGFGGIVAVVV